MNNTMCQIGTTGKGMPCLANIYTLAGIIQPCEVCALMLPEMRKLMKWTPFRGRFYMSNKLTTEQHNRLLDAIPKDDEDTNLSGGQLRKQVGGFDLPAGKPNETERSRREAIFHRGDDCDVMGQQHYRPSTSFTAQNIPQDAEAELSAWYTEVDRNRIQNERDAEEQEWARQELLQDETDNT